MRPHRRRGPLQHVLVAGSFDELPVIEAVLLLLPKTAYGQVLVETPEHLELPALDLPPRMTVARLARGLDDEPGLVVSAAVQAWLEEWTPAEPDPARVVTAWVGGVACNPFDFAGADIQNL